MASRREPRAPESPAPDQLLSTFTDSIVTGVTGRSLRVAVLPILLHDVHALDHLAEDAVLVVEPRRRRQGDEELAAVGVRARRWPSTARRRSRWRSFGLNSSREFVAGPAGARCRADRRLGS